MEIHCFAQHALGWLSRYWPGVPYLYERDAATRSWMTAGVTTFEYLINRVDTGPARAETFFKQFRIADSIGDPSPIPGPADRDAGGCAALGRAGQQRVRQGRRRLPRPRALVRRRGLLRGVALVHRPVARQAPDPVRPFLHGDARQRGRNPGAVNLVVTYRDGSTETVHDTPAIWEPNVRRVAVRIAAKTAV